MWEFTSIVKSAASTKKDIRFIRQDIANIFDLLCFLRISKKEGGNI